MVRECVALLLAAVVPGCSLILDFDSALPADAATDAVYNQAECDFGEPNDTLAEAVELSTGDGAICAAASGSPEDHDYYRFTATGAPATIAVTFTSRAGGDLDIKLYASDGTMIAQSRGFGDGETIVCPGAAPLCPTLTAGSYVFEVFPGVNFSVNNYSFTVTQ